MIDLDELKRLARLVTPGEWQHYDHDVVSVNDDALIASIYPGGYTRNGGDDRKRIKANAALICILRNNLPSIIAALETAALVRDRLWLARTIYQGKYSLTYLGMKTSDEAARAIIAALPKDTDNAHD